MQGMLHELRTHQIELEMQNEELREAQLALNLARARYFDLYDMAPLGYVTFNPQGLIEQVNLAAANLLGVNRAALLKKPVFKFIFKQDQDIFYLKRKQLIDSGKPQSFELRLVNKSGKHFWAFMEIANGRNEHGVPELRAIFKDVSERKQLEFKHIELEQALLQKNLELDCARLEAERANQAKSDCLSAMSHELRTPLNSILGFAQLLSSGKSLLTPLQEKNVKQIITAGWYLRDLVNEILDIAQIESGKLQLTQDTVSLRDLLLECQTLMQPMVDKSQVRLDLSSIKKAYWVKVDRTRLKQVIINLLSNTIKYSNAGGIVEVSVTSVTKDLVRIGFQDYGPGLTQPELEHLFEPFNRLGREGCAIEGYGIGLVVCKRYINVMGGDIGVESSLGKGSLFWIQIPLIDTDLTGPSINL